MKYTIIFIFSIIVTVITNHLLLAFSKNLGIRGNEVKQVRWASTTKPSLGGFAFYIVFLSTIVFLWIQDNESTFISEKQFLGLFIAVSIGFLVGFADDTYNTNPLLKFIGQFLSAIVVFLADIQIYIIPDNIVINFIFTSLWVVGLMNSINMLDNMDGITASASGMIIIGMLIVMGIGNNFDSVVMFILFSILASVIGFLYHNWNPAKMYMGDAGSQFLGVFLAIFSILIAWRERDPDGKVFQFRQFVVPALLFIIPLIDTITVTFRRLMRRQSPFVGGRDHTTHHFVYYGLKERDVALLYIIVNALTIVMIALLCLNRVHWNSWITFLIATLFVVLFSITQVVYNWGHKKQKANEELKIFEQYNTQSQSTVENTI